MDITNKKEVDAYFEGVKHVLDCLQSNFWNEKWSQKISLTGTEWKNFRSEMLEK